VTWNEVVVKLREYSAQMVTKPDNEFARMADSLERHADKINEAHRLIDGGIQMLCQGAKLNDLSPVTRASIAAQDVAKLKTERDACMALCETVSEYFRDYRAVDLFQDGAFRKRLYAATVGKVTGQPHGQNPAPPPPPPPKKPDPPSIVVLREDQTVSRKKRRG